MATGSLDLVGSGVECALWRVGDWGAFGRIRDNSCACLRCSSAEIPERGFSSALCVFPASTGSSLLMPTNETSSPLFRDLIGCCICEPKGICVFIDACSSSGSSAPAIVWFPPTRSSSSFVCGRKHRSSSRTRALWISCSVDAISLEPFRASPSAGSLPGRMSIQSTASNINRSLLRGGP